jgi:septal ring factor EnvC (AmiA/AmiB activator)
MSTAARAAVLMKTVAPALRARGEALGRRAEAIRRLRRELALADEAVMLSESALADGRAEIDRLQAEQAGLEGGLPGLAEAEARARALAARAGSVDELVSGLESANRTPPLGPRFALAAPVQGELVRRFGQAAQGAPGGAPGRGSGLTWRTGPAAEVLAPADARVDYVGPLKGYGLVVILSPSEPYHLVLAGLDRAAAGAGRTVASGEPIGRMAGSSGPPPELYLEVREAGRPVDPARWLAAPRKGRARE